MVRLGDLGQWIGGGTPSKSRAEYWSDGTVPWLSPKDMRSEVLTGTQDRITEAAVRNSAVRLVPAGSVAVVMRSGILERTLPVAVVPFATTLNQDMKALSPRAGVDARWVGWALRSIEHRVLREVRKAGTTVASIEAARLMDQRIPLPDEGEQRRIVAILEEHLSDLDGAVAALHLAEVKLRALAPSWLSHELSSLDGELRAIGSVLTEARGGWSRSSRHLVPAAQGVPYLKMNNITSDGSLSLGDLVFVTPQSDSHARYGVRRGDVLFNSKNSAELVGKTAFADKQVEGALLNENIMRLRFSTDIDPTFAWVWFQGPVMKATIADATRASTNVAAIYQHRLVEMPILVPSMQQQTRIAAEFTAVRDSSAMTKASIGASLRRAESLRGSLLAAAFSGRLTGHGSDTDVISELAEEEFA